jgi:hypothetical protein
MLSEVITNATLTGAINANAFANSRYATLSRPARVTYYAIADGPTGLAGDDLLVEITHGNVIVRSNSSIPLAIGAANVGVGPNKDQNLIASAVADINDRIVIRLQNDGAATANSRIIVDIDF